MNTNAAMSLQLIQYAEDFQELLGRHNDLLLNHENLRATHTKLTVAGDILSNRRHSVDTLCIVVDHEGRIQCASDSARSLLGLDKDQNISFQQLLAPFHHAHGALMLSNMNGSPDTNFEHTELTLYPAGDPEKARLLEVMHLTVSAKTGARAYLLMRDLSDKIAGDIDSQRSLELHQNVHQGLMITNADGDIMAIDPHLSTVTGQLTADVQGKNFSALLLAQNETADKAGFWNSLQRKGEWHGEADTFQIKGGTVRHWLSVTAVKDDAEQTCSYVWAFSDIDRLLSAERILLDTACHDPLTGLANLALFRSLADERITRAWRGGARITLIYVELDGLQWIKDVDGDACADSVVVASSIRIQEQIRGCDSIARAGFDKFTILLIGPTTESDLINIETRLKDALAMPIPFRKKTLGIRAHIGRARFPQDGIDTAMLLTNAETALKQSHQIISTEHFMETLFTQALARKELYVAYLPHFSSEDPSQLLACEVQLRWNHPLLGNIAWQDFCEHESARCTNVAANIWALKTACETLVSWHAGALGEVTMVLNITPFQLRSATFTNALVEALKNTRINPNSLELTLSEAQNLKFPGIDVNYLRELRKLGVKVSIRTSHVNRIDLTQTVMPPKTRLPIERRIALSTPLALELIQDRLTAITRFELVGNHEELITLTYRKGQAMQGSTFHNWALNQNIRYDTSNAIGLPS